MLLKRFSGQGKVWVREVVRLVTRDPSPVRRLSLEKQIPIPCKPPRLSPNGPFAFRIWIRSPKWLNGFPLGFTCKTRKTRALSTRVVPFYLSLGGWLHKKYINTNQNKLGCPFSSLSSLEDLVNKEQTPNGYVKGPETQPRIPGLAAGSSDRWLILRHGEKAGLFMAWAGWMIGAVWLVFFCNLPFFCGAVLLVSPFYVIFLVFFSGSAMAML